MAKRRSSWKFHSKRKSKCVNVSLQAKSKHDNYIIGLWKKLFDKIFKSSSIIYWKLITNKSTHFGENNYLWYGEIIPELSWLHKLSYLFSTVVFYFSVGFNSKQNNFCHRHIITHTLSWNHLLDKKSFVLKPYLVHYRCNFLL